MELFWGRNPSRFVSVSDLLAILRGYVVIREQSGNAKIKDPALNSATTEID
jgi:hypothetical protein